MTQATGYEQALEAQLSLHDAFGTTALHRQVGRYALGLHHRQGDSAVLALHPDADESVQIQDGYLIAGGAGVERLARQREEVVGAGLMRRLRHPVLTGEVVYVTAGMVAHMDRTQRQAKWEKAIERHDMLAPSGVVLFEQPWSQVDESVDTLGSVPIRAMVWMPHPQDPAERVLTLWFVDCEHTSYGPYFERAVDRWMELDRAKGARASREDVAKHLSQQTHRRWLLDTTAIFQYGSAMPRTLRAPANRNAFVLFRTLLEPIAGLTGVPPSTSWLRKDAKRAKLPNEGEINVLYLRRQVNRDPKLRDLVGRGRRVQYRHHVRSHWRRYWVGSGERRHQEWRKVREHWRGDGPTIATDNVYVLKR